MRTRLPCLDSEFLAPFEERGKGVRIEENGRHEIELKLIPVESKAP